MCWDRGFLVGLLLFVNLEVSLLILYFVWEVVAMREGIVFCVCLVFEIME